MISAEVTVPSHGHVMKTKTQESETCYRICNKELFFCIYECIRVKLMKGI